MAVEVVLPKVDMDMESGTIAQWRVAEGQVVKAGDILFEMETSKSLMEVEAPASGRIRGLATVDQSALAVGTVVAWIDEGEAPAPAPSSAREHMPAAGATDAHALRATPYARSLAREQGIDLRELRGSGPEGRVVAADVEARARTDNAKTRGEGGKDAATATRMPFSPTRRTIAERLAASARNAPHFYLTAHIDMGSLRDELAARRAAGGPLSATLALVHIVGRVLARHPMINASLDEEGLLLHRGAHIGVAMDREGDLVVPVLRDVDTLSIEALAAEYARVRERVKCRAITPAEMRGGSFTISNLGMYGVDAFTAIINPPEAAILAIGRTLDTPVGRDGAIVLRPMATFCLSSDHRIVDGATAARFMADLRTAIEAPRPLSSSLNAAPS